MRRLALGKDPKANSTTLLPPSLLTFHLTLGQPDRPPSLCDALGGSSFLRLVLGMMETESLGSRDINWCSLYKAGTKAYKALMTCSNERVSGWPHLRPLGL